MTTSCAGLSIELPNSPSQSHRLRNPTSTLEDPDDDSPDSDEDNRPTTARLISVDDHPFNQPSLPSHVPWSQLVNDDDQDEEDDLWGADTGREAVGADERPMARVPSISVMATASASFFDRASSGPSLPAPTIPSGLIHTAAMNSMSPTEEWRSKILESVRKGEEKVAQRRKASMASLDASFNSTSPSNVSSGPISKRVLSTVSDLPYVDPEQEIENLIEPHTDHQSLVSEVLDPSAQSSTKSKGKQPVHQSKETNSNSSIGSFIPSDRSPSLPAASTSTSTPSLPPVQGSSTNAYASNNPYLGLLDFESSQFARDVAIGLAESAHGSAAASLLDQPFTTAINSPLTNPSISSPRISDLNRDVLDTPSQNTTIAQVSSPNRFDHSDLVRSNSTASPRRRPHTFTDTNPPRSRPNTWLVPDATSDEPPPPLAEATFLSVTDPREISSRINQISTVDVPRSDSPLPSRLLDTPIPSQPIMPARSPSRNKTGKRNFFSTLLHRASGNGSSANSSPGPSLSPNHLRANQSTGAFSQTTTPQLNPSPHINPHGSTHSHSRRLSRSYSESATERPQNLTNSTSSLATPHNLKAIGLKLTPLTPFLPISRNAHPLCGAILDNKYLLIGTNHGLDFVPLPHLIQSRCGDGMNGYGTAKPMTLIKKTRFKSLKVLEVRSNILLAIAGRNDHLRVYALDGIRAIIAKKMQDLEDKDDYVWLAKPIRSDSQSVASKGKGRAKDIRTNDLPHHPSIISPPPPYGNGASQGPHMAKSHSLQPGDYLPVDRVSPTTSPVSLRRSSTVGARLPDVNHQRNIPNHAMHSPDSKRVASGLPSFLSSFNRAQKNIPSTPPSLSYQNESVESPALQPIRDEIGLGLEREVDLVDGPSQLHPAVSSSQLISQDDGVSTRHEGNQSTSSHSTDTDRVERLPTEDLANPCTLPLLNGKRVSEEVTFQSDQSQGVAQPEPDLVELIRQRKQKQILTKAEGTVSHGIISPQSNLSARSQSRRLVARSPLIGDTDEESIEGVTNEYLPISAKNKRLSLLDILSQSTTPPSGGPLGANSSTSKQTPVPNKRWTSIENHITKPQKRADSSAGLAESSLPENSVPSNPSRHVSSPVRTSETLSVPTSSLGERLSPTPTPASSPIPALVSRAPTPLSPPEPVITPAVTPKSKKRWSVMDSVFRTYSSNSREPSSSAAKLATLIPSISNEVDTMAASDDQTPPNNPNSQHQSLLYQAPLADHLDSIQLADATPPSVSQENNQMLRPRESMQKIRPNSSQYNSNGIPLGASNGNDASEGVLNALSGLGVNPNHIVGTSDDQPRERLATHHHGHNPNDPKTSPHPATLGAPLEYVKLARTKGAKLLRAFETKRRTYLAVLCGESSERIELFTGSKNISLSLNRTFVLPETPRTIEFQMQGDDLVDIYLVYDESVFALEPATVRVREVGIGRNERRAARRERERAARDLASTNLRQPVTANTGVPDDVNLVIPTNLAQSERSDSLGLQATVPNVPPAVPVDEGLTLSVPPNSSSRNANSPNAGPTVVAVVTANNNGASGWGTTDNNATAANKPVNLWPYTTFQQLQSIPPLPASVLASTFVIPPTYEAVVMASGGPNRQTLTPSHSSGTAGDWANNSVVDGLRTDSPPSIHLDQLAVIGSSQMNDADSDLGHNSVYQNSALANAITNTINNRSELTPTEVAAAGEGLSAIPLNSNTTLTSSPGLLVNDGPLLSPISLLANPHSRQIGPPGLFLVSRGKKITSIVDCDGRSVMKKPFVWSNDKHSKPSGNLPENPLGFKIDMIIVQEKRTMMVGVDSNEVKVFEIGGQPAIGLEEYSNSITLDIIPQFYGLPSSSFNMYSNSSSFGGSLISSNSNFNNNSNGNGGIAVGGGNGIGVITSQNGGSNFIYPNQQQQSNQSQIINQSHPSSSSGLNNGNGMFGYHLNQSNLIGISTREIIYLGFNDPMNQVIWSERRGNMFGIYCLEPI